jgi:hypothetical protein
VQAKIKVKLSEVRDTGRYFLITSDKGILMGDWRDKDNLWKGEEYPLRAGQEYAIEWQFSRNGKYRNIKQAYSIDKTHKGLEEI